ncbi:MAG: FHA domain-containing protein [Desertimonas sp.]
MDISDQALDILKFVLLGLLYLFFARVLWAVWSEVRRTDTRPAAQAAVGYTGEHAATVAATRPSRRKPAKGRGGTVARLSVLEPKARRGAVFAVSGDVSIGRDPASTVVIDDDTFVSTHHAKVYVVDGQAMIEDLGSTNGTFHNGNRLHGAALLHRGDRIQFGYTVLEAQ